MKTRLLTAVAAVALAVALPLSLGMGTASSAAVVTPLTEAQLEATTCAPGGGTTAKVHAAPSDAALASSHDIIVGGWSCGGGTPDQHLAAARQLAEGGQLGAAVQKSALATKAAAKTRAPRVTRTSSSLTVATTALATSTFYTCNVYGCYYWGGSTTASWTGDDDYGYYTVDSAGVRHFYVLGNMRWYFTDGLNGRETITSPQTAIGNRAVTNWRWYDERVYLSDACPGGCLLSNRLYRSQAVQGIKQPGEAQKFAPAYLNPLIASTSTAALQLTSWQTLIHIHYWKDLNPRFAHITWYSRTKNYKLRLHGTSPNFYYLYETSLPAAAVTTSVLTS